MIFIRNSITQTEQAYLWTILDCGSRFVRGKLCSEPELVMHWYPEEKTLLMTCPCNVTLFHFPYPFLRPCWNSHSCSLPKQAHYVTEPLLKPATSITSILFVISRGLYAAADCGCNNIRAFCVLPEFECIVSWLLFFLILSRSWFEYVECDTALQATEIIMAYWNT